MKFFVSILLITLLLIFNVQAQKTGPETKHFEKAGLEFDFPAEWKLTDSSTDDLQYVTVTSKDSAVQIAIITQLGNDQQCDFPAVSKRITNALLEGVATQIHAPRPRQTAPVKTQVGDREIEGVHLRGLMNNRFVTSEVYSLRLNQRFVNLVYLRADDDPSGQSAWESMLTTLKLGPPIFSAVAAHADVPGSPNVMNGRAIHLVQPPYPLGARQLHATGTVIIKVVIDESGDVILANATSGHPLLQPASVVAARASKFSPTKLCGEPVRITGVIQYSFYMQ